MLLFYEVLTRARRRLYFSYPGMDDKGQPLLASPYLAELEQICGNTTRRFRVEDLSPIPPDDSATSAAEQRVRAMARAVGVAQNAVPCAESSPRPSPRGRGDRRPGGLTANDSISLLAGLARQADTRAVFDNILAGLAATHSRGDLAVFGPYEGMLLGQAARDRLAERFSPDERWSASRLEQYGACPYRFFLAEVLRLTPVEDLSLRTDYQARGSTAHDVLAKLHRELNEIHARAVSPAEPEAEDAFRRQVADWLDELERRADDRGQPYREALAEIDRRVMRAWLDAYLAQHRKYDALWRDLDVPLALRTSRFRSATRRSATVRSPLLSHLRFSSRTVASSFAVASIASTWARRPDRLCSASLTTRPAAQVGRTESDHVGRGAASHLVRPGRRAIARGKGAPTLGGRLLVCVRRRLPSQAVAGDPRTRGR